MNDRDRPAAFLGAAIDPFISLIDLHLAGDLEAAIQQLERELDRLSRARIRYCRVIHGIGTGVLSAAVHNILAKNKQIFAYTEAEDGGSCLVLF